MEKKEIKGEMTIPNNLTQQLRSINVLLEGNPQIL